MINRNHETSTFSCSRRFCEKCHEGNKCVGNGARDRYRCVEWFLGLNLIFCCEADKLLILSNYFVRCSLGFRCWKKNTFFSKQAVRQVRIGVAGAMSAGQVACVGSIRGRVGEISPHVPNNVGGYVEPTRDHRLLANKKIRFQIWGHWVILFRDLDYNGFLKRPLDACTDRKTTVRVRQVVHSLRPSHYMLTTCTARLQV